MMESRERRWMLNRLAKHRKQEREAIDSKIARAKAKGRR